MKLQEIEKELNKFDLNIELRLSQYEYIKDLRKCVKSHLTTCKSANNNIVQPYKDRLIRILNVLHERNNSKR